MRDLASINQEAAQLRAQADGLHKAALGEMRKLYADVGQEQDAAAREAAKAHKAAEEATGQATRELKNAEPYRGDADAADVEAARLAGAGDASGAEEMR